MPRKRSPIQPSRDQVTFGRRLRMWRKLRKLSQHKLAVISGLGYSHINELEQGKLDPLVSTVRKLAQSLDVSPAVFFLNRDEALVVAKQLRLKITDVHSLEQHESDLINELDVQD